jgi:hypothetical protein
VTHHRIGHGPVIDVVVAEALNCKKLRVIERGGHRSDDHC